MKEVTVTLVIHDTNDELDTDSRRGFREQLQRWIDNGEMTEDGKPLIRIRRIDSLTVKEV